MDETNTLAIPHNNQRPSIAMGARGITPRTIEDLFRFAKAACETDFVPKEFRGSPEKAMIAMEFSLELGLPLLAGLRSIAVINGRPSVWGDLLLGMVRASGLLESFVEDFKGQFDRDDFQAVCVVKRVGCEPRVTTFSVMDAKRAKLWGKNIWESYPKRMLQMRARGFALRDEFGDVLMGLVATEEAMDSTGEMPRGPQAATVAVEATGLHVLEAPTVHPTSEQIKSLRELIQATGANPSSAIQEFFDLPREQRLTLKYLCERLTMDDYSRAWDHYNRLIRRQVEEDVDDFDPPAQDAREDAAVPPGEMTMTDGILREEGTGDRGSGGNVDGQPLATAEQLDELRTMAREIHEKRLEQVNEDIDRWARSGGMRQHTYEDMKQRLQAQIDTKNAGAQTEGS